MDTRAATWCVPERRYISEFKACNRYVAPSQGKVSAADPPSQRSRGLFRVAGRNRIEDPSAFWGTFPSISNSVPICVPSTRHIETSHWSSTADFCPSSRDRPILVWEDGP